MCNWHSEPCWEPRGNHKYIMVGNLEMLGTFRCQGDIWGLYLKTRLPRFLKNMASSHAHCWSTNGVHCQHHQWNMTEVVVWVLQQEKFWFDYCWSLKSSNHQEGQEEGQNLDILSSDGAKRQRSLWQQPSVLSCFIIRAVSTAFNSQHLRGVGHALITALQSVF